MTGTEIVRVAIGDDAFDATWSAALVEMIDAELARRTADLEAATRRLVEAARAHLERRDVRTSDLLYAVLSDRLFSTRRG